MPRFVTLRVTRRARASILAALRYHQAENLSGRDCADGAMKAIASDRGRFRPLSAAALDRLCRRLIAAGGGLMGQNNNLWRIYLGGVLLMAAGALVMGWINGGCLQWLSFAAAAVVLYRVFRAADR